MFDSAQANAVRSQTQRCITNVFRKYHHENEFFCGTVFNSLSGTQMGFIHEKKLQKISLHCLVKQSYFIRFQYIMNCLKIENITFCPVLMVGIVYPYCHVVDVKQFCKV